LRQPIEASVLTLDSGDPEALAGIFRFRKLSDLKKHCRAVTLHGCDLANLIILANSPLSPLCHLPIFLHHHPEHLALREGDLKALVSNGVGPMSAAGRKTVRKLDQIFLQRRLLSAHLFWQIEDPEILPSRWHLFYFDNKSVQTRGNHWKHGSHIHLMNHLTHPALPLKELLDKLDQEERPRLGRGLHIRWLY
jgi:hypothetical protein